MPKWTRGPAGLTIQALQCCPAHAGDLQAHLLTPGPGAHTHQCVCRRGSGIARAEQQAGLLPPPSVTHVQPQWGLN